MQNETTFTRRAVLRAGAGGVAALAAVGLSTAPLAEADVTQESPLALGRYGLNADWLFAGVYTSGAESPGASESGDVTITLPHTVADLSWSEWDATSWEQVWIYRKHLSATALSGGRAFIDFQGVMTSATVYLNGSQVLTHQGGYLPFSLELTPHLIAGDNVLAVAVDGTLQNVPPNDLASPDGPGGIDYLQPAGIYREVTLRIEPVVFVGDVFAKPTNVLAPSPGLDAVITVDAGAVPTGPVTLTVTLLDGQTVKGQASGSLTLSAPGPAQVTVSLTGLDGISLWSPESPQLYAVQVSLDAPGASAYSYMTRTGFRQAVFAADGFYLNGARYPIFGVNRHQLFPYTGMAASRRMQYRDVQILRSELNANMVRASHYPQSEWFLDACDELGLMVWQEPPGWGYVNNTTSSGPAFQALVRQNVQDMIVRDRSRPSVIVWATRLNETSSVNNEALYAQTNQIAADYDSTRQTTGAMNNYSVTDWNQQVFAYDDYTYSPMGSTDTNYAQNSAALKPPIKDAANNPLPYFVSESVGAIMGAPLYRWIDSSATLGLQAKLHAQAHSQAGSAGYAGLLGWCAFDYASLSGANKNDVTPPNGSRIWRNLKTPGVLDFFRVPKPGAAIYRAQTPSGVPAAIFPAFIWDFGSTNPNGPGANALVFTNCASIRVALNPGTTPIPVTRLTSGYENLAHPPFNLDLSQVSGSAHPDLTITGLDASGNTLTVLTMSSDPAKDVLRLTVDDSSLVSDGADMTRFTLQSVDAHGNPRPAPSGQVALSLTNSVLTLIADTPFPLDTTGGSGGGFLRSRPGVTGSAGLVATHPQLAPNGVTATVTVSNGSSAAAPVGSGGLTSTSPIRSAPPSTPPAPVTNVTAAAPLPTGSPLAPAATRTVTAPTHPKTTTAPSISTATLRSRLHSMLALTGPGSRLDKVRHSGYTMTFLAPAAGRLVVGWYATEEIRETSPPHRRRGRRVLVASANVHIARSGHARLRLHLSAPGRSLLAHAGRVSLTAEADFTPTHGHQVSASRHIELRR